MRKKREKRERIMGVGKRMNIIFTNEEKLWKGKTDM
jgi:hypothetical protein